MLVSLDDMKTYLGIDLADTTYDAFLTQQILTVSEAVEGFCGRIFTEHSYVQTFYADERLQDRSPELLMFHFPVTTVSQVLEVDSATVLTPSEYRSHGKTGYLKRLSDGLRSDWFANGEKTVEVSYIAGYATIPYTIQSVVYSIVGENYAKKSSGIGVDFGSDVQSVSIPGVLNVAFDYTLQANDRKSAFGMILGNYVNVLEPWSSERVLVGQIELDYVE